MTDYWLVVALSLGAALAFAGSTSLKHLSAGDVPDAVDLRGSTLGRFVRATVSHRLWLAGVCCDVVGLALQVVALHLGALSLVQPLLVSSLLFALVIRGRVEGRRLTRRQGGWAVALTGSLCGFLLLAAAPHAAGAAPADPLPAVIVGLAGAAVVATCIYFGRRQPPTRRTAALLGTAVGIIYAGTAALIKSATAIVSRHPLDLLVSWQLYAVLAVGAGGLLLSQLTFQAGPLTASLPATATADPLVSIVIGVAVYDEQLRGGSGITVALCLLLAVLGLAVVQLSREPTTTPTS